MGGKNRNHNSADCLEPATAQIRPAPRAGTLCILPVWALDLWDRPAADPSQVGRLESGGLRCSFTQPDTRALRDSTIGGKHQPDQSPRTSHLSPRLPQPTLVPRQPELHFTGGESQASPHRVRTLECHSENKFSPRHSYRLTPTLPPKQGSNQEPGQPTPRSLFGMSFRKQVF